MILNEPIAISQKTCTKEPSRKRSFTGWFKVRNTSVKTVNGKETKKIVSELELQEKNKCQPNSQVIKTVHKTAHHTEQSMRLSLPPPQRILNVGSLRLLVLNTKYSCVHNTITLTNGYDCLPCKINKWLIEVHHSL